ncbi:MAG: E2/UBC family protein [Chloroflexota bacterium]
MPPSVRAARVDQEVGLLLRWFDQVDYDHVGRNWVLVHEYPLPHRFNKPSTPALLLIPADYPQVPPDGLFIDKGLNIPGHYFQQQDRRNPFGDKDWAWLCAHLAQRSWRPSADVVGGDNLVTLLGLYATIFAEMRSRG